MSRGGSAAARGRAPNRERPSSADGASSAAQLLTADQVAERWQVPRGHVYALAREGKLPTVRLGRYRRWRLADLQRFEEEGGVDA